MDKKSGKGYRQLHRYIVEEPAKLIQACWWWYERSKSLHVIKFLVVLIDISPDAFYLGITTVEDTVIRTLVTQARCLSEEAVEAGRFDILTVVTQFLTIGDCINSMLHLPYQGAAAGYLDRMWSVS